MAVVTTKTTAITALDANSSKSAVIGEALRVAVGTVEVANGDSIGSKLVLLRLPSHARVSSLELSCDAITSAAADVGLYDIAANGGAVVDADLFGSAVSLATAIDKTNVLCEAVSADIQKVCNGARLWERLGLSADPNKVYDVVLTLTAAATAAGSVGLMARYST